MKKILLLSVPFGALERPSLGISILKAKLEEDNIPCEIQYLTLPFAEMIGVETYQWMCYELPYTAFAGDWAFTSALYEDGDNKPNPNYIENVLRKTWYLDNESINRILHIKSYIPSFIEYCMESIKWEDYSVIGFTSTFEQNIASLALAKKVKEKFPKLVTVFGGANWEAEMGLELHKNFSFVDYVCSGESEESFPKLVKAIAKAKSKKFLEKNVNGIVLRNNGKSIYTGMSDQISELDGLPYPDFSDYFGNLNQSSASKSVFSSLLFETARGCWWGAKSHCTFCGLNGNSMAFRSKSPKRVLDELDYLSTRWKTESVEVVDNILDMKYFDNVIPALAKAKRPFKMFYEVKSNLKRKQVKLLHQAGVNRIQPGIESLSNNVLKLMRKGTSGLKNIQLLKWAKEYNVDAEWNLLYGFPGETRQDYEEILNILPSIRFLKDPCAVGPIRLDRFSPYYNSAEEFGLINLRPLITYEYLYPFEQEKLMKLAYYFEFDYEDDINPRNNAAKVIEYINWSKENPETGNLYMFPTNDEKLVLMDTRSVATIGELHLNHIERSIYEYCDETRSLTGIMNYLKKKFVNESFDKEQIRDFLDSLVGNHFMVTDGIGYLSLAIRNHSLADAQEKLNNGISNGTQKPLSSYLARELPILKVNVAETQKALC